jgi:alpha-glucosidase (family GH31 glycosyl hydrolase)
MKPYKQKNIIFLLFITLLLHSPGRASENPAEITSARKINPTTIEVSLAGDRKLILDFYGENIFRLFRDDSGRLVRDPEAQPEARILVEKPRKPVSKLELNDNGNNISITTEKINLLIDKNTFLLKIVNLSTRAIVVEEVEPVRFEREKITITLKENPQEYFYGGGVQNGRFSHKGKMIAIENQNSWTDGGVASPTPFYWSTNGYAVMWHTFKKGKYDFGAEKNGIVKLYHETDYIDVFFMIDDGAAALLNDFYQLTGNPVLLPKFGFYQGHLNAYNRDYWTEDEAGTLFEDGKRYKESQKNKNGIRESLNGENDNYQFSARAVIDRYKNHDMPLGWLLPNDGYGAGYGQTETLNGNIRNLKSLGDYARANGVEIGLWTQSDLHPKPEISTLLQRDIVKEVLDAGVRVLKTDVAWVGAGYSFGLSGIADVAHIMRYYGNNSRPFIISLDGWAGTQHYAGIWSGDQTGGVWEYIRFHIPTYIGSGLSGQPNITSDMDGIFGGKNPVVNTRDFQWKTFTPMQLNMDGWGANEKYPHAPGEPATSINRHYLKLKAELIPYTYSIAKEAVAGLPIIRALFPEYPNLYTKGKSTQYEFLYGPNFLIAPIYQETKIDEKGNDVRNGIYLPEGFWIDYFTGDKYEGNRIINSFAAPLWKLPVFVKNGAIIPMTNPNNNVSEINKKIRIYEIYPCEYSSFTEYDDDGISEEYKSGKYATTFIESSIDKKNKLTVTIHPAQGNFEGFVKEKTTELRINVTEKPEKLSGKTGNNKVKLKEAKSRDEFREQDNVFFYDPAPNLNRFATPESEFEKIKIIKNPQLLVKMASSDITANPVSLYVEGFIFNPSDKHRITPGALTAPLNARISDENTEAYTLKPTWDAVNNADYYEIDFNGMLYTTVKDTELLFDGLEAETPYSFKIRAVNKDGYSDWTPFGATTKTNPLQFAIRDIQAKTTAENQGGSGIEKLFNFDESDMWHTRWSVNAVPFDLVMDLKTINRLDKFHYLPRNPGVNGILLKGTVYYGNDGENWLEAGTFEWTQNADVKIFNFAGQPAARYVKISVTKGVGGFGSGRELYVFKVPGTESYLPGDNNIDEWMKP